MLSASIVTYKDTLDDVVSIIRCLIDGCVTEIFVVDNSPTDSLRPIASLFQNVHYEFVGENIGYGAGHNRAIRKALESGKSYHLVVNVDVSFSKETLPQMVRFMDDNLNAAMLVPKVFFTDGRLQYNCKILPTPLVLIQRRFLARFMSKAVNQKYQLEFTGYDHLMNIPYASGCFMLFRVDAFRKVGLFDEQLFLYSEDIDISRRMHRHFDTIFYPDVSIEHVFAGGSKKNLRLLIVHVVNIIKYFNKWGWFHDEERNEFNRRILSEESYENQ